MKKRKAACLAKNRLKALFNEEICTLVWCRIEIFVYITFNCAYTTLHLEVTRRFKKKLQNYFGDHSHYLEYSYYFVYICRL